LDRARITLFWVNFSAPIRSHVPEGAVTYTFNTNKKQ